MVQTLRNGPIWSYSVPQAPENHHTNFYRFLMMTVILDDLSFRESFINPNANQLTEEGLLIHGVRLYYNAHRRTETEKVPTRKRD
ncbi:hypothetical protein EVAR_101548_1 [Eumeta japonica]|uniref:Uncharacterized protein n=1 Tax=Eumeta variegata TaxID=151549 RepID=A0A4C1SPY7_EUMVA|nr:hypothetical protein EVAR_101548_1 [Eumeta japonica]